MMGQLQQWAVGYPLIIVNNSKAWNPCEALVRIGCKEISRLSETLIALLPRMEEFDAKTWLNILCKNLGDTLSYSVELEGKLHDDFVCVANGHVLNNESDEDNVEIDKASLEETSVLKCVSTPYGDGQILHSRIDAQYPSNSVKIDVVRLDSGATLYGPNLVPGENGKSHAPTQNSMSTHETVIIQPQSTIVSEDRKAKASAEPSDLEHFISPLRVRSTAAYCLQKCISDFLSLFSTNCGKEEISALLHSLEKSRIVASKASVDKDLSASFEEAILVEWGDKVEDTKKAFSSDGGVGHLRRSEMFFLTQESCANNVLIHFLALLYCPREEEVVNHWDTTSFAAPLLMTRITDVLQKFIVSEREDGHRIDPNVWRTASESGGTFAVHCTSFAVVVVNILNTMMRFSDSQFNEQKAKIFPILCSLITIQSSEIRDLVAAVMERKVSVLLGIQNLR